MKKKLTELFMKELDEVSFVDEGAGIDVPIKIIKRRNGMKFNVLKSLFKKALEDEEKNIEQLQAILEKMPPEDAAVIMEALASAAEMEEKPEEKAEDKDEEKAEDKDEEKVEDKDEEKVEDEDEEKAVDEDEEKSLAKRYLAENKSLKKSLEEIRKVQLRKAAEEKADKLAFLPGASKKEFVNALLELTSAGTSSKTMETIEKVFKASNEIIKRSEYLTELGTSVGGSSAEGEYQAKVAKLMSDNPSMTKVAAKAAVIQNDPELYNRLRNK